MTSGQEGDCRSKDQERETSSDRRERLIYNWDGNEMELGESQTNYPPQIEKNLSQKGHYLSLCLVLSMYPSLSANEMVFLGILLAFFFISRSLSFFP